MSRWYLKLGIALLLTFLGLFIHWSVVVAGAAMPFVTVLREWLRRRAIASQAPD
ncbi:MAG: hypothetical protein JJT85_01740 [Chromatiales bacterium]|nr:hypothetical protein [Chromatiales bacterium]